MSYTASALLAVGMIGCTFGLLILAWCGLEQLAQWNAVRAERARRYRQR